MPGKKLLVADDSLTIQKVIRLALSNEGYEIQAVSDGNDAIQQMTLFQPDVVLIDVSLPTKSAFEVKRELNEHEDLAEVRFVLMSSAFEKVDEEQAEEVQFHGRLTKPFDPAHLRQVLTDVLMQVHAKRMEKTSILKKSPDNETPELPDDMPPPDFPAPPVETAEAPEPFSSYPSPIERDSGLYTFASTPTPKATPDSAPASASREISKPSILAQAQPPPSPTNLPPRMTDPTPPNSTKVEESIEIPLPDPLPTPPPTPEELETLWGTKDANQMTSEFLSTPSLPNEPSYEVPEVPQVIEHTSGSYDEDIRTLTHSTMADNGYSDYSWSVNEPSMKTVMKESAERGSGPMEIDLAPSVDEEPEIELPVPEPRQERETTSRFVRTPVSPPPIKIEMTMPPPQVPSTQVFSREEVEAMVKQQVQEALEKMAQKILPEVAEKLIKQEIHKILSDS